MDLDEASWSRLPAEHGPSAGTDGTVPAAPEIATTVPAATTASTPGSGNGANGR